MNQDHRVVGLLHAGEMGAGVAQLLLSRNIRVVATLQGRSEATARRCHEVGIAVLDSIEDVVNQSDVVISLVPPAAAASVVEAYAERALLSPARAIFVDMNSISPERAATLSERLGRTGRTFVDAAVNVGSSRVDLQACKLEYSIVSPK